MNTFANIEEEHESQSCYFWNECEYLLNSRIGGAHRFLR